MPALPRKVLTALLSAAVFAGPAVMIAAPARAADDDKPKKEKKEGKADTELQKQMEVIEAGMKKLRKSLRKADENEASLATIADMKKAATASKDLVPAMAASVPEAKRKEFVENYQKDMTAFIAEVDKMEAAVKANKNDDAVEIHKKLKGLEDAGHEKYTKE